MPSCAPPSYPSKTNRETFTDTFNAPLSSQYRRPALSERDYRLAPPSEGADSKEGARTFTEWKRRSELLEPTFDETAQRERGPAEPTASIFAEMEPIGPQTGRRFISHPSLRTDPVSRSKPLTKPGTRDAIHGSTGFTRGSICLESLPPPTFRSPSESALLQDLSFNGSSLLAPSYTFETYSLPRSSLTSESNGLKGIGGRQRFAATERGFQRRVSGMSKHAEAVEKLGSGKGTVVGGEGVVPWHHY